MRLKETVLMTVISSFLSFSSFAKVFNKLIELGVPKAQFASEPYHLKTMDEQDVAR
jgi:hypothetical protein